MKTFAHFAFTIKLLVSAFLISYSLSLPAQTITSITLSDSSVAKYCPMEITVYLTADFHDPYNSSDIKVDAWIEKNPDPAIKLPCFYKKGNSELSAWAARFTPTKEGNYSFVIHLDCKGKQLESIRKTFKVIPSDFNGFINNIDSSGYYFLFSSGKKFRGIGTNFGWEARNWEDQKYSYEYYLKELAKNGGNLIRTWMCPWNLPLEWNKVEGKYKNDSAAFNASAIEKTDRMFEIAEKNGIYILLVLDFHGALKTKPDYWGGNNYWLSNPYNVSNGGVCRNPQDFFTQPEAIQKYKDRLRYIIARWGYRTNLLAIEFWNEIDNAMADENIPSDLVIKWHDEMSEWMKINDPYHHLLTTSLSHRKNPGLFQIKNLDFVQSHLYGKTDNFFRFINDTIGKLKKAYVVGEFAYDWKAPAIEQLHNFDNEFHNGSWRALFSKTAILPLTWWWEYLNDNHVLDQLKNISSFSSEMLSSVDSKPEEIQLSGEERLEKYCVEIDGNYYMWIKNNKNEIITNAEVGFVYAGKKQYSAWVYNTRNSNPPGTLQLVFKPGTIQLKLPEFKENEDLAIIVKHK